MNDPLVSVIIPTYNYGRYLKRAVDSVCNQTISDIEIIVVDDHSTDNTPEVMNTIDDARVNYIRQSENVGQSANRNAGIACARGKYVAFLDADDWWKPEYIETMLPGFDDPDVGVTYCRSTCFREDGGTFFPINLRTINGYVTQQLFLHNFIGTMIMVRRELLGDGYATDLIPSHNNMGVDWWILLELSIKCKFRGFKERNCNRQIHASQISHNDNSKRIITDAVIRDRFYQDHPGAILPSTLRQAKINSLIQKAEVQRADKQCWQAIVKYLKAICLSPIQIKPYKGVILCAFYLVGIHKRAVR